MNSLMNYSSNADPRQTYPLKERQYALPRWLVRPSSRVIRDFSALFLQGLPGIPLQQRGEENRQQNNKAQGLNPGYQLKVHRVGCQRALHPFEAQFNNLLSFISLEKLGIRPSTVGDRCDQNKEA